MRTLGTIFVLAVGPAVTMGFAPHGLYSLTHTGPTSTSTYLFREAVGRVVGRFREKKIVEQPATIQVGQTLPEGVDVIVCGTTISKEEEEPKPEDAVTDVREALGKGKALLIGMPGAFTPTCTEKHLPGYVEQAPEFKQLGYDTIAILTTNDRFVNDQWIQSVGAAGSDLRILSDGDGDLVRMLGLSEDMGFGVGVRSKRFALVLEDGTVTDVLMDEGLDQCSATSSQNVLKLLREKAGLNSGDDDSGDLGPAGFIFAAAAIVGFAAVFGGDTLSSLNFPN